MRGDEEYDKLFSKYSFNIPDRYDVTVRLNDIRTDGKRNLDLALLMEPVNAKYEFVRMPEKEQGGSRREDSPLASQQFSPKI